MDNREVIYNYDQSGRSLRVCVSADEISPNVSVCSDQNKTAEQSKTELSGATEQNEAGQSGEMAEFEKPLRSFTRMASQAKNINYWEPLNKFKVYSNEWRTEIYKLLIYGRA